MRLLQLNPNGSESSALDFHPMVTVVNGLSSGGRELVIRAITALPTASDPGCGGLVEAHGILMDLSTDTLHMLDLGSELDVLVRAADIPGVTSATGAGMSVQPGAGSTNTLTVEQFLSITDEGDYPDLDAARRGQGQAREALAVLREAAERARKEYSAAQVRKRQAEAALEQATSPQPHLRLVTDGFEPDEVADDTAIAPVPVAEQRAELEARIEELSDAVQKIARGLGELGGIDTRPIQVLLEAIHNPGPVEMVPSERGAELADEFVRLQSEVGVLEESLEARNLGPATATARLDEARTELNSAEKAMRKPELTEQDRIELEAAHDEVLANSSGRGRGGKKKLEDAMVKEQAILDRVGFPTWSAYVMGAGLLAIDPAAEQRVERARFELEAAESHWSDVAAMIEADPVHRELLDQLEALYLEAFDLLGGDDEQADLEVALRSLQEPKSEISTDELVDALAYQLELVGIQLPEGQATIDRTVMVAEAFLAEAGAITERLTELEHEHTEMSAQLAVAEQQLSSLPAEDAFDESAMADDAEGGGLTAGGAVTDEELAELEKQLEVATEDEVEYNDFVEAREALLDAAIQVETVATSRLNKLAAELAAQHPAPTEAHAGSDEAFRDVEGVDAGPEAIEFYLLARLAALRSVSYAGSVPLVIDDALALVEPEEIRLLLAKLERMSESVQIVYLTDDATVSDWADSIGFERAAVVRAPEAFA